MRTSLHAWIVVSCGRLLAVYVLGVTVAPNGAVWYCCLSVDLLWCAGVGV